MSLEDIYRTLAAYYGWTFRDISEMTLPQVLAAWPEKQGKVKTDDPAMVRKLHEELRRTKR